MTGPLSGLACLVLAHDNPEQLLLLLRWLDGAGARSYVHLDPRADPVRAGLEAGGLPDSVAVLPKSASHAARWGSFGLIRASLALMRAALAEEGTTQLCLLSGTHLPVRPPEAVAGFLMDGKEHIDLRFAASEHFEQKSLRRFWYMTLPGREEFSPLLRWANRHSWRLGRRDVARTLRGMTPMVGSQWLCLTAATARRCLEFLDANPWYVEAFRFLHIPDESFFHTLVGSIAGEGGCGPPFTYQRMYSYSPVILEYHDVAEASASSLPFARKFDMRQHPDAVRAAFEAAGPGALEPGYGPRAAEWRKLGLRLVGPAPEPAPGEIVAVVVSRNEALRLPAMLDHARLLGVDRVIVIDNQSTDGTRAYVQGRDRTHLIAAEGDFAGANFGIDWVNAVLDAFCRDNWVLVADADELLVYPGSDKVGLHALCRHLDAVGAEALPVVMLDCFPGEPLHHLQYRAGEDLIAAAPWFELPELRREAAPNFPYFHQYGGMRERLFFPEADPKLLRRRLHLKAYNALWRLRPLRQAGWFHALAPRRSPNLAKVPLLRWRAGARLISNHTTAPMALQPDQPTGVLLHFKFLQDFHDRVLDAVERNAHYDDSREYRRYWAVLERNPEFCLRTARSLCFRGPDQLTELGLMHDSALWREARMATPVDRAILEVR